MAIFRRGNRADRRTRSPFPIFRRVRERSRVRTGTGNGSPRPVSRVPLPPCRRRSRVRRGDLPTGQPCRQAQPPRVRSADGGQFGIIRLNRIFADGHGFGKSGYFAPLFSHAIIKTPIKQGRNPRPVAFSGIFTPRNTRRRVRVEFGLSVRDSSGKTEFLPTVTGSPWRSSDGHADGHADGFGNRHAVAIFRR